MYLLVPANSTILTPSGNEIVKYGEIEIRWYTMDGYECDKDIHIVFDHSTVNIMAFRVTTRLQPSPHLVTFLITDGHLWSEPRVGMRPIRYLDDELREDEILSVERTTLDEGYFYNGIPIGAVINGYLAYPTHTSENKMIDPISK